MKNKKKKTKRESNDGIHVAGEPLQGDLPGMEDAKIAELESLAERYAEIRDKRIALNKAEVALKDQLIVAMHENEKEVYRRDGIEILLVAEEETVKVRVAKHDE